MKIVNLKPFTIAKFGTMSVKDVYLRDEQLCLWNGLGQLAAIAGTYREAIGADFGV